MLGMLFAAMLAAQEGTPPHPLGVGWITEADYPAEALRYDREGRVAFTLTVSPAGRVTGCAITQSSGASSLDATTCRLAVTRARFTPATDAMGRVITSTFSSAVNWKLPPKPLHAIASWSQLTRIVVDGKGGLLSCSTSSTGTVPPDADDICKEAAEQKARALALAPAARGQPGPSSGSKFVQVRMALDGDALPSEHHLSPGVTAVSLIRARFEIAPNGAVENCRVVEGLDALDTFDICKGFIGPFVANRDAAGQPRRSSGTMIISLSTQASPARR